MCGYPTVIVHLTVSASFWFRLIAVNVWAANIPEVVRLVPLKSPASLTLCELESVFVNVAWITDFAPTPVDASVRTAEVPVAAALFNPNDEYSVTSLVTVSAGCVGGDPPEPIPIVVQVAVPGLAHNVDVPPNNIFAVQLFDVVITVLSPCL